MEEQANLFFSSISSQVQFSAGGVDLTSLIERFKARNERLSLEAKEAWCKKLLEDKLLVDISPSASLEEVESQIALETGYAFLVHIIRHDGEKISTIFFFHNVLSFLGFFFFFFTYQIELALHVFPRITLKELKQRLKVVIESHYQRPELMGARKISWKHIWRTTCLSYQGKRLLDDSMPLQDLGIPSGAELSFVRRNLFFFFFSLDLHHGLTQCCRHRVPAQSGSRTARTGSEAVTRRATDICICAREDADLGESKGTDRKQADKSAHL